MFDMEGTTAAYTGRSNDVAEMVLAVSTAMREAREGREITDITIFIPNDCISKVMGKIQRLIGSRAIVEAADGGVTLCWKFKKTIHIELIGAPAYSQNVPDCLDLAGKSPTLAQANESVRRDNHVGTN